MADLSVTAASVSWTGKKDTGLAGGTVTRGQPLYRDSADGARLKAADADVQASSVFAGFALNDAGDEQPVEFGYGEGTLTIGGTSVSVGVPYFVSPTAGGICPIGDIQQGDFVTYLGVGATAASIKCAPHSSEIAEA